jgi:hypothetical protein
MSVSDTPANTSDAVQLDDLEAMGPIDYLVVEFPHRHTPGEGVPIFLDLVDRGIIRVLDLAFVHKDDDGSVHRMSLEELGPELAVFEGASANFLQEEDFQSVGEAIGEDSTAVILVYENHWAASLARAMRLGGGQLVASERLPVQAILAALDATEPNQN